MANGYETRTVPAGADDNTATHRIGIVRRDDVVNNQVDVRTEQYTQVGPPLQFQRATTLNGITILGNYPGDGDGLIDGATAGGITLDAGGATEPVVPDWDITGYLICILSGNNIGQVRRVIAYNTTTKVATIDRVWDATTPSVGDQYTIGLDCERKNWMIIKAECEGTFAQSPSISVIPMLLDYPRNPATSGTEQGRLGLDGVKRAPIWFAGAYLDIDNYDFTEKSVVSNYYHMRIRSDQILGATIGKVRLVAAPGTSKKVTLWLGSV